MSKDHFLTGVGSNVSLGENGPRIKVEEDTVSVRNKEDTKYIPVKVGTPKSDQDAVNVAYLENRSHITVMGGFEGKNPPTKELYGAVYIVLKGHRRFKENKLYKWMGGDWEKVPMFDGMRIVISESLLDYSETYNADHVYVWREKDNKWEDTGAMKGLNRIVKSYHTSVTFKKDKVKVGEVVQARGIITNIQVYVKQPFNTEATLTIGDDSNYKQLICEEDGVDLQECACYEVPLHYRYATPTQIFAYLDSAKSTQGKLEIVMNWSKV